MSLLYAKAETKSTVELLNTCSSLQVGFAVSVKQHKYKLVLYTGNQNCQIVAISVSSAICSSPKYSRPLITDKASAVHYIRCQF